MRVEVTVTNNEDDVVTTEVAGYENDNFEAVFAMLRQYIINTVVMEQILYVSILTTDEQIRASDMLEQAEAISYGE